ncbi:hypothetical protein JXR74_00265 [Candidatus Mcinerneyibacteriota bacterium]|nr:hypothetical protein [Candidatus Mcinerneyibacteriota bacterium]
MVYLLAVEGRFYSQEEIHDDLLGLKGIPRGAYSREITEALEQKGYRLKGAEVYKEEGPRALTDEEARSLGETFRRALDKGHPVFIGWYPWIDRQNGKRGHFSVLGGYDREDFFIYDPRYGEAVLVISQKTLADHLLLPTLDRTAWGIFYFYVEQAP